MIGGDGRYWNDEAVQIILRVAAGNGVKKVLVGKDAILSTPAVSAIIRATKSFGKTAFPFCGVLSQVRPQVGLF